MKCSTLKATVISLVILGATGGVARAQDNDGCSNATLKGDYAFTVSGQIFKPVPTGSDVAVVMVREGVAMTHFDGRGNLSQVDFVLSSPNTPPPVPPPVPLVPPTDPVTGFHTKETGTYTVYPDCTGTFNIHNPDFVNTVIPGAVITVKFVLSNGGRSIHTIVTSLIPPGATEPVPALIHSEGHKLGRILQDQD
jgi:hypothetical protein